jgi:HEPN domain-containing protein
MKRPDEYARILLKKARDDALVVSKGAPDREVADWIVGFHAQQSVEKALKAVLSFRETEYPHTHSLKRLLAILKDAGLALPPDHARLPDLSQFAGDIRYGARVEFEPADSIDRTRALGCTERTLAWAAHLIESE